MTAENIEWRAERFELPSCWLADKRELLKLEPAQIRHSTNTGIFANTLPETACLN